jgi:N-acyl-D-aspartate/D-glutamate deacylase
MFSVLLDNVLVRACGVKNVDKKKLALMAKSVCNKILTSAYTLMNNHLAGQAVRLLLEEDFGLKKCGHFNRADLRNPILKALKGWS